VNAFLNARKLFLKWTLRRNATGPTGGDTDETDSATSATVARSEIG